MNRTIKLILMTVWVLLLLAVDWHWATSYGTEPTLELSQSPTYVTYVFVNEGSFYYFKTKPPRRGLNTIFGGDGSHLHAEKGRYLRYRTPAWSFMGIKYWDTPNPFDSENALSVPAWLLTAILALPAGIWTIFWLRRRVNQAALKAKSDW
jgi:hypothetical protein